MPNRIKKFCFRNTATITFFIYFNDDGNDEWILKGEKKMKHMVLDQVNN